MRRLTKKEKIIMEFYWTYGPMFIRELQDRYPEPKPTFSTLSNQVRTLQADGFMSHHVWGSNFQYYPLITKEEYCKSGIHNLVDEFFRSSYANVVLSFVKDEKLSVDELEEIIEMIKKNKQS